MAACVSHTIFALMFAVFIQRAVYAAPSTESILGQILGSKYTGLIKMLEEADLLSELETYEQFSKGVTIFAPSDHYLVDKASPALLNFLSQPSSKEYLRKVLLHHIVPSKIEAQTWYPGMSVKTFAGTEARLFLEDGELHVDDAIVKELGVLEVESSVVHSIDGLLVPRDVLEAAEDYATGISLFGEDERRFLQETVSAAPAPSPTSDLLSTFTDALEANGNFSQLLELLTSLDLLNTLSDLLSSGSELTIFAPDNSAFSDLGSTSLTRPELLTVLQYHIVDGAYSYDDLLAIGNGTMTGSSRKLLQMTSGTITTLANETITVTNVNGVVYLNGVPIVNPNILPASDGLAVQGVESVLLPPSISGNVTSPPPPVSGTTSPPPSASPPPSSAVALAVNSWFALLLALVACWTLL